MFSFNPMDMDLVTTELVRALLVLCLKEMQDPLSVI